MTVTAPEATGETQGYRWRWIALFVILAAEVMDLLDALVTAIAAPTIQRDLGGSDSVVQWLGAGYTLAMAVGLITGGRLGDLYGKKRMFLIGALGFTTASLLCGVAVSPEMLIASRVLQGLFGAVMLPQGLGLIKEMFPPSDMGKAFGMFGPVMTISSVGGPVLAGWLVDADFFGTGWRMIFLINLPLGLAAALAGIRFLPEHRESGATRLDLGGVGLVSLAALLLTYPLIQGRELGWPWWTFASMAASVVVFALFGRYESRRAATGRDPLVTPSLFRKRAFTGGLVAGLAFFSGVMGFGLVFSLYAQNGLGFTPLQAGLAGLPQAIGGVIGFGLAMSGLQERLGRGLLQIGAVVMGAGAAVLALTIHVAGTDVTAWQLAPGLGLAGIGMGLVMAPFFDIVLAGVEPHESGSASGTMTAVQQLGGALGTAVLGTLFFNLLAAEWGFGASMEVTVWVEVGLLALTFALSYLMPRHARPEQAGH
ncbi:DHA2 family efflux MFS transporter permease subunit [Actinomadura sp. ATCC 31491]|uniref:DHA2 family efflux MFS transporter permease subunit n=1 Tax=Actinomadura luzonensis TaxID=2805427 RepID=A0ABT0FY99_9ACTN|nr:DHA2 family efflux MFS transporter permease subunit [Actinomadura luzonensis]MCK2217307.1 DHA2 family efflux MFS transporter permease subunit [Actinomadura luzonensis]